MDDNQSANSSATILYILIGLFSAVICIVLCGIVVVSIAGVNITRETPANTAPAPVGDPNDLMVQAMALEAGAQDKAIDLLQQAEASLDENHMLIRSNSVDELAALGAAPLTLTPSVKIESTPIPVYQP